VKKLVFVIMLTLATLAALTAAINSTFCVTGESAGVTTLTFRLPSWSLQSNTADGLSFQQIVMDDGLVGATLQEGLPELPTFTTLVAVPRSGEVSLEVTDSEQESLELGAIWPVQAQGEEQNTRGLSYDTTWYGSGGIYPQQDVLMGDEAILRDFRVVPVTIQPFRYDPVSGRTTVTTQVQLSIHCSNPSAPMTMRSAISRSFDKLYRMAITNYDTILRDEDYTYQPRTLLIIYVANNNTDDMVNQIADWKRDKGFIVTTASTSVTGGSSSNIQSYIQNAYNTWDYPPEYIMLIGDTNGTFSIPTGSMYDHSYTMLDGGDILPEAFIGRVSIESSSNLSTYLSKINLVERQPYLSDLSFYNHSLLVGDAAHSGTSTYMTGRYCKECILSCDPDHTFTELFNTSPGVSNMSNAINNGSLFFEYRGYIGMSGWDANSASSLTNYNKITNAVILTCDTGTFDSGTSRTEALIRAGSSTAPTGSHSAIGMCTAGTHTQLNNMLTGGIFYGLSAMGMRTMGEANMCGKLYLYLAYNNINSSYVSSFTSWCNLMGDPSLDVWCGEPKEMNAAYATTVSYGQGWIDATVTDEDSEPIEGAWVTARNDDETICVSGYTNADGIVTLRFASTVTGEVALTITKPDYIPILGAFNVSSTGGVSFVQYDLDDDNSGDSHGNNDGEANPGEGIELVVGLHNYTSSSAGDVTAVLSCTDPYITINDATEDYGAIAAGTTGESQEDYDIEIAADTPDNHQVVFTLTTTSGANTWTSRFWLTISGCDLDVQSYAVVDGGNSVLDPEETATLQVTMVNNGQVTLSNVTGRLVSLDGLVRVDDNDATFGSIAPGNTATCITDAFEITALSLLVPGMQIPFQLTLSNAEGYEEVETFMLQAGTVSMDDPLGPDSYGYVVYDSGDTGYIDCPVYDWIEINPSNGGPGTQLTGINDTGNDQDDIVYVNLPFTFTFYGEDYTQMGISSNGFVTFSPDYQNSSFRNWPIPGAMGPSPMIAAMWDDLWTNGGGVFTWYNGEEHFYVVQWDCVNSTSSSSDEVFEIILYDPEYYLTSTFDGPIKIQYQDFNNVDSYFSASGGQGNYCTVGLEDHTELAGLQYTYNNTYPTAARAITDGTALYFTGRPVSFEDSYLILGNIVTYDEDNSGIIDVGESVDLGIYLENVGLSPATNVSAVLSTTDAYVSIITEASDYSDIPSECTGVNRDFFTFDVSTLCPDGHAINFTINCSDDDSEWVYAFTLVAYKPRLEMTTTLIWDAGGNNDGIMDPGEEGVLIINVANTSDTYANDIQATLTTSSPYITLEETSVPYPSLKPGANAQYPFAYTVSSSATVGSMADFTFSVGCTGSIANSWDFQATIGVWGWSTDFESGNEGFTGEDEWAYGTPTIGAHSGTHAWGTNLVVFYSDRADESLYTNQYYIGQSSQLIFWHDYRTQTDCDGGNVKISIDGGNTWSLLYPQGGYDGTANSSNVGIPGEQCFTGYHSGYSQEVFDLGDYAGNYAILRFHFGSDGSTVSYGWTIDDVTITGSQNKAACLIGTLTLDNPNIAVSEARVSVGDCTVAPMPDGSWVLYAPEDIYDLTATCNYFEGQEENNVVATQGQTSADHNFTLEYLDAPFNPAISQLNGTVTLLWSFDRDATTQRKSTVASRSRATFQSFRVWRRIESGMSELVATGLSDTLYTAPIDSLINYYYWVEAVYDAGVSMPTLAMQTYWNGEIVSNQGGSDQPLVTGLRGNYPNPFNPETTVSYSLAQQANVELCVYNIRGQRVATLVNERQEAGAHQAVWHGTSDDGRTVGSGVYFLRMHTPGYTKTTKMLLLK